MNVFRVLPVAMLALSANAFALDYIGTMPAAHMELKDSSETIVCFAYDTDVLSAPIASGCPEGSYTEQLFDESWNQIGQLSVVVGGDAPDMVRSPVRVEQTCVWDYKDFRDTFSNVSMGDNMHAWCSITCPDGVAIDAEATATIPELAGGDDAILERVSYTVGTGEQTIDVYVESDIPINVAFERFTTGDGPTSFDGLTYVIEAAAVCL